jgi:hypothetical protein
MTKRIVFEIDEELHTKLKLYCTHNKTNITREIKQFICSLLETEEEMKKEAETEAKKEIPLKQEKSFDIVAFREGLGLEPKKEKLCVEDLD